MPKTDYTIIDNWFVMGMSATGSKDFQLKDEVFVPEHRALSNQDLTNGTGPSSEFMAVRCTVCPVMQPCRSR